MILGDFWVYGRLHPKYRVTQYKSDLIFVINNPKNP